MTRSWRVAFVGLVAVIGVVVSLAIVIRDGFDDESLVFILSGLVYLAVSGVLVIRVPRNHVSWALMVATIGQVLTGFGTLLPATWSDPILGSALFIFTLPCLGVLVPLWFPTGQPPTSRWRWVAWLTALGVAMFVVGGVVAVVTEGGDFAADVTCTSPGTCLQLASVFVVLFAVVIAIVSLIVRWIRSGGVERVQLRWLLPAFAAFGIGAMAEFGGYQNSVVADIALPLGALLIPVSVGVAVLRYRLYEIDRIISRTVSYALVVGLLVAVVAGVAALAGAQFDDPLVVAATTLGVAALFNPLRNRTQRWVDRRFNRAKYDAELIAEGFASGLSNEVDSTQIVEGWTMVVATTLQPTTMGVWVR